MPLSIFAPAGLGRADSGACGQKRVEYFFIPEEFRPRAVEVGVPVEEAEIVEPRARYVGKFVPALFEGVLHSREVADSLGVSVAFGAPGVMPNALK